MSGKKLIIITTALAIAIIIMIFAPRGSKKTEGTKVEEATTPAAQASPTVAATAAAPQEKAKQALKEENQGKTSTPVVAPITPTQTTPAQTTTTLPAKITTPSAQISAPTGTVTTPTLPAVPGSNVATQNGEKPLEPAKVEKIPSGCTLITYKHKKTSGHSDDDSCSQHKNLITLKDNEFNKSTVCVKVNGRPVTFQLNGNKVLIGAVAGPSSEITVRYCLGKTKCSEDCSVPKDEFMAAIGGSESAGEIGTANVWDADGEAEAPKGVKGKAHKVAKDANVKAELDKEISSELEKLDEKRPNSNLAETFEGWNPTKEAPSCGTKELDR